MGRRRRHKWSTHDEGRRLGREAHMAPARCRGRAAAKKGGGELVGRCTRGSGLGGRRDTEGI